MNQLTETRNSALAQQDDQAGLEAFDQAAARFLATRKSETTRETYGRALALYRQTAADSGCNPFLGDCVIAYNEAQQQGLKSGRLAADTVRTRLRAVASFLSWCYRYNLTPLKPELVTKDLLAMPAAKQLSPRDILTVDEARRLLEAAPDRRAYILLRILLDTGLRIGEALGLRCEDIYPASVSYFIHVAHGKGDKARDVKINAGLYQAITGYLSERNLVHPRAKVFGRLHRTSAWRYVTAAAAAADIDKDISPHSLRHTHGNTLAMAGWPIELIGERLGHVSYDTTKRYTRPAQLLAGREAPELPWNG